MTQPVGAVGSRPADPRVSVLINNYNYGRFLGEAVESALAQDFRSAEIIVVDDGSTDRSQEVLEAFGGRIRVILQANGGQAAAMNAAVAASSGDLLCFLNSDDRWTPGKLSAVVEAFDADPGAVLVYHRLQPVRDGSASGFRPVPRSLCSGDLAPRMLQSAGWWPFPMTSAVSVRRSAWNEAGDIPDSFRISADAWLVGIYPFLGRVTGLPEALGDYRIHNNNWYRDTEDASMLRRRMAHWEATVDATNRFLGERGSPGRLRLAAHLPHRLAAARLAGVTPLERLRLAAAGLGFPGEPNPLRRVRDTLRTMRDLPRSAPGDASPEPAE